MKIYHNIPDNKNLFKNPVVTIGNFDGVHIGHQKILRTLKARASQLKGDAVVITFSTHPKKVINPDTEIKIITTTDEKVNAIFNMGITNIILLNFTKEMSRMGAADFYNEILLKKIDLKELVIGYDHAFGKDREGNFNFLKKLTESTGIAITKVEEEDFNEFPISSTWIRSEIEKGNMEECRKLLGRPYSLRGLVERGAGRGKNLGFPTANIHPDSGDKIIPGDGVYAVTVTIDEEIKKPGMMNIGYNPTFSNSAHTLEVNIFDFNENIYDEEITVEFHKRIRSEEKFETKEDLIQQMYKDREKTLEVLKS